MVLEHALELLHELLRGGEFWRKVGNLLVEVAALGGYKGVESDHVD